MTIEVRGLISRGNSDRDHDGVPFGMYGSLREAMSEIGDRFDKGEDREVICFYFYEIEANNNGMVLVWTLTPNLR
jgi:hypothetical protein